ncbi:hypothetical protein EJ08DRAFT_674323 [Tothia fuscella]|uniref:Uncharacterized protein n=1 Tax=Tothia fuscella TaxID=1048955 RepID=A0A9P4U3Y4_9PEZI|nr:hypothetical protein EJ08DRAFT_674323 [Tothia fuscella]
MYILLPFLYSSYSLNWFTEMARSYTTVVASSAPPAAAPPRPIAATSQNVSTALPRITDPASNVPSASLRRCDFAAISTKHIQAVTSTADGPHLWERSQDSRQQLPPGIVECGPLVISIDQSQCVDVRHDDTRCTAAFTRHVNAHNNSTIVRFVLNAYVPATRELIVYQDSKRRFVFVAKNKECQILADWLKLLPDGKDDLRPELVGAKLRENVEKYWSGNGKSFRLFDLPIELREHFYLHALGPIYPTSSGSSSIIHGHRHAAEIIKVAQLLTVFCFVSPYGMRQTINSKDFSMLTTLSLEFAHTFDYLYFFRADLSDHKDWNRMRAVTDCRVLRKFPLLSRLEILFPKPTFTTSYPIGRTERIRAVWCHGILPDWFGRFIYESAKDIKTVKLGGLPRCGCSKPCILNEVSSTKGGHYEADSRPGVKFYDDNFDYDD